MADLGDEAMTTTRGVLLGMWLPLGIALLSTYGVVAGLGWWRPVVRDERPTLALGVAH